MPSPSLNVRLLVAVIAVGLALWLLSDVVLLIFLAVLIAIMLRGLSDALTRHSGLPTGWSLALVSLLVLAAGLGLAWWVGPRFAQQGVQLWSELDGRLSALRQRYGDTPFGHLIFHQLQSLQHGNVALIGSVRSVVTSTIGLLGTGLIVLVTALYLAIDPRLYMNGAIALLPLHYRGRAREIMLEIGHTLRWWLLGQAIDMVVVGVLAGIGLELLGIPLALALAVVAGVLTFVPYFGAIAASIPGVIVALSVSWSAALWVIGIFLICHGVEGYLVAPLVQRRTVHLPPALTILSMTVLGAIYGVFGVVLATPLVAAALVLTREAYVRDMLGDTTIRRFVGLNEASLPHARSPGVIRLIGRKMVTRQ